MKTPQEVYDACVAHLASLPRQSIDSETVSLSSPGCRYRSASGLKCVVGALIPDDLYAPWMEGKRVGAIADQFSGLPDEFYDPTCLMIMGMFQRLHDDSRNWHDAYTPTDGNFIGWYAVHEIAVRFNLDETKMPYPHQEAKR